jgi:dipeptidase E
MRMYLSSFLLGNQPEALQNLAGSDRRAAIIVNALDNFPDKRGQWLDTQRDALSKLDFAAVELDLRAYFGRIENLRGVMASFTTVWVNGGNSFILRRAMKQSGFDTIITEALARDTHVYAGFSAGAVVCSSSLRGLALTDDPVDAPDGYDRATPWGGLDLLPYAVVVHYQSNPVAAANAANREIGFYEANCIPYRTLRDGQALVIDGATTTVIG